MSTPEKHLFRAEIQQVLNIVVHSLYKEKNIFIRELISNAADACEKLRFAKIAGIPVFQPELPLRITVETDETRGTIVFSDTGIGMTREELEENLGTIAHSGTRTFLEAQKKNPEVASSSNLIGQFGVGFYSTFMVAGKVSVFTRSHLPEAQGWLWNSDGAGGYEIEPAGDLPRGTRIVLDLKPDSRNFLQSAEVEQIIKRYSNFVQFEILLNGKQLNTVQAIWCRNKKEVTDDEYNRFYQFIAHDPEPPLFRIHVSADAPLSIQALLFVPQRNPEIMGTMRTEPEVNLYCRKVLIEARARGLIPEWMRFLRGVVDSEDLPLNISRETLQDSSLIQKLKQVLTGRFIKHLEELAEKDPELFEKFYTALHRYLKEGVLTEFGHVVALSRLLRFESSVTKPESRTSLADYVKRMPTDQKEIYFLSAPHREAAESSPYFEAFRARGFEVLFLYDQIDEYVMDQIYNFDGKQLVAVEKAEIMVSEENKPAEALAAAEVEDLAKWLKEHLGERIEEVRVTRRLVESPAAVFDCDKSMTSARRQLLKSMRTSPGVSPFRHALEINPNHPVISRLDKFRRTDPQTAGKIAEQLLDNSRMIAGMLDDARPMLKRINELLECMMAKQ